MNFEDYSLISSLMSKIPPKKETPEGQKFHIGEIVKITNPKSWFAQENKNKLFEVQYSYCQKYGGTNKNDYSLRHLWEDNSSAWYEEKELELVKGIDEIIEERDKAEYKRLKEKYEKITT